MWRIVKSVLLAALIEVVPPLVEAIAARAKRQSEGQQDELPFAANDNLRTGPKR